MFIEYLLGLVSGVPHGSTACDMFTDIVWCVLRQCLFTCHLVCVFRPTQHTNSGELRTYVSLNLALTYLKLGPSRNSELAALMKALETDSVTDSCQSLRAALHYVRGLYAFTQLKVHDAK